MARAFISASSKVRSDALFPRRGGGSSSEATRTGCQAEVARRRRAHSAHHTHAPTALILSARAGCRVRYYNFSTSNVTTIAGGATCGEVDGVGTAAKLWAIDGLALDAPRNVLWCGSYYTTTYVSKTLRRIDLATSTVTSLPNSGVVLSNADGIGTNAAYNMIRGLAIDSASNT